MSQNGKAKALISTFIGDDHGHVSRGGRGKFRRDKVAKVKALRAQNFQSRAKSLPEVASNSSKPRSRFSLCARTSLDQALDQAALATWQTALGLVDRQDTFLSDDDVWDDVPSLV